MDMFGACAVALNPEKPIANVAPKRSAEHLMASSRGTELRQQPSELDPITVAARVKLLHGHRWNLATVFAFIHSKLPRIGSRKQENVKG